MELQVRVASEEQKLEQQKLEAEKKAKEDEENKKQ